ncbi:11909_t:CDS:1, partial [Dentiscutata erythropus]
MTLFHLAAKLECAAIHIYGSICDGAGENRRHIKSFDWFATIWKVNDKVEVQLSNKLGKKSYQPAKIISFNSKRTKFLIQLLGSTQAYHNVSRSSLRPPMPGKIIWKINDQCEVRSTIDNEWYLGKVLTEILTDNYLDIEVIIESNGKFEFFIYIVIFALYIMKMNIGHHIVFKKLRNNVSKSHISNDENKNIRKIMFNGWEISWRHFRGVYDHTTKHMTAKATKLTKRHIWLTTWSKMRVDLVEHTLSLDVEKVMANIPELSYISQGTQ